jgi:hypothetical protein
MAASQVGDTVKLSCLKPPILLGKARVVAITTNSITVTSHLDTFTFNLTNVTVSAVSETSAVQVSSAVAANTVSSTVSTNKAFTEEQIMELVLGSSKSDTNYNKATAYYKKTMGEVHSGQTQLTDLVSQAKALLKQMDESAPERKKDPAYEEQYKALQDFVARADAGETITQ